MSAPSETTANGERPTLASVRDKWPWFFAVGVTLIVCGLVAITLPSFTSMAASLVLGVTLVVVGVVKIVEALKVKEWPGFVGQLMLGVMEVVGGVMIYLSPFKRTLAITLLIAIVFVVQGVAQIGLAFKMRHQPGWCWLLTAGVVAICASSVLLLKFPYTYYYHPAALGGLNLLAGGFAYIVIAFAIAKVR